MNEASNFTIDPNQLSNFATYETIDFAAKALETTKNITGPQAVVISALITSAISGACFVVYKAGELIKGGYIKEVDLKDKKIVFGQPADQEAA